MHMSRKQALALARLDRFIGERGGYSCDDRAFERAVLLRGTKRPPSPVSGEEAFFLVTDRGMLVCKEDVTDWERFKQLMIAHRMFAITVAMWKEDLKAGLLFKQELIRDGWGDMVESVS